MKDSDTGIIIKTGNEIEHEIYTAIEARQQDYVDRLLKSRWAHIDSLQKEITNMEDAMKTHNNYSLGFILDFYSFMVSDSFNGRSDFKCLLIFAEV